MAEHRTILRWPWRLLTLATVGVCAWRAHHAFVRPLDLPSGDAGYYSVQALRFRELLESGDLLGFLYQLTQPELHPPLHALLLAAWSGLAGVGQSAMRSYGVAMYALAAVLLVLVARRVAPKHGEAAGLVAVGLTALGWFHRSHLFTTMTEPTATVAWLLALLVAVKRVDKEDWLPQLDVGLAIALATLVRYNLFPMLLVPLVLHRLVVWRGRGPPPWRSLLVWVAPSAVVFLIWALVVPELPRAIWVFFGLSGGQGLAFEPQWLARTLALRFAGGWLPALALSTLFVAGLAVGEAGRELRLLQVVVGVGLAVLMVHPAMVVRNVSLIAPLLWLCALLPWAGVRPGRRWVRPVVVVVLLAAHGLYQLWPVQPPRGDAVPPYPGENVYPDYLPQPELRELMDLVEPFALESRWLLVAGHGFSRYAFPLWALDDPARPVVPLGWGPDVVQAGAEPGEAIATYVLVSPPHPPKKGGEGADLPALQQALAAELVPVVAEQTTRHRWRVRVYQQRRAALEVGHRFGAPSRRELVVRELDVAR